MMTVETVDQLPASREELVDLIRDIYREQKEAAGKKVLSVEQIRQEFLKLPGEECRQYELAIAGFGNPPPSNGSALPQRTVFAQMQVLVLLY